MDFDVNKQNFIQKMFTWFSWNLIGQPYILYLDLGLKSDYNLSLFL